MALIDLAQRRSVLLGLLAVVALLSFSHGAWMCEKKKNYYRHVELVNAVKGHVADISKSAYAPAPPPVPRESDEEMEQRLKWRWVAINKCQAKGFHAAMGFNDEVLCLDPVALAWVYDGKGPPK